MKLWGGRFTKEENQLVQFYPNPSPSIVKFYSRQISQATSLHV